MTIAVNVSIKLLVVKMVEIIGLNTESRAAAIITPLIFVCQYFNTGWLLALSTASMEE